MGTSDTLHDHGHHTPGDMRHTSLDWSYHVVMQGHGDEDGDSHDGGPQFAEVFVIVWVGAMIVTLNTKLLGESEHHY